MCQLSYPTAVDTSTTKVRIVPEPRWLTPDEDRAWRGWLTMQDLLRSQVARDLQQDCGMSDADYMVLVILSEHEEGVMRMTELAAGLKWSKSRLSHQIGRMESRGLVRRADCPSDGRGSLAVLTDDGRAEIERAAPWHVASVRRHLIDLLQPHQLQALAEIADVVVTHLRDPGECQITAETDRCQLGDQVRD